MVSVSGKQRFSSVTGIATVTNFKYAHLLRNKIKLTKTKTILILLTSVLKISNEKLISHAM